jgi:hypothetical protein
VWAIGVSQYTRRGLAVGMKKWVGRSGLNVHAGGAGECGVDVVDGSQECLSFGVAFGGQ